MRFGFRSRWSILLTSQYLMNPESPAHGRTLLPPPVYLGLESGGHSERTSKGLPPLCTVGAAEFEPPASGRIALFSIAIEFDVSSPAFPEVALDEVVQLVSCFSLDEGATDWPTAAPATTNPTKIATLLLLPSLSQATVPLITGSTSAVAQRSLQ